MTTLERANLELDGQQHAEYNQNRRNEIAKRIRKIRSITSPNDPYFVQLDEKTKEAFRRLSRNNIDSLLWGTPDRLASPSDMLKLADAMDAWAKDRKENTNWESLWCGEQDALADRIDQAHYDAKALRAYARTFKKHGSKK